MFRSLTIAFDSRERFAQEYHRNIANGGLFIPTDESYELREVIEVELDLRFCDRLVTLQAEVVTQVGSSLEAAGAQCGVAVQFLSPADELRDLMGGIAGISPPAPPPDSWPGRPGPARQSERARARVAARVEAEGTTQSGLSRDLSRSGVLVSTEGEPVPVGDAVELRLVHPTSGEELSLEGRVTRHVESEGRVAAIAIQFDLPGDDPTAERLLDDVRSAGHARQLGAITGPIEALGLANLLQTFASCSEGGTLIVMRDQEEGRIAFQSGALLHAAIGPAHGLKALARMAAWEHGSFEFHPEVGGEESADEPIPIYGALMEAVQHVDELRRSRAAELPLGARACRADEGDAASADDLDKIERAVLDLAGSEISVGQILDAFPEYDSQICEAVSSLLDRGLLRVDS